jgi:hypothetical protein
MALAAGSVGVLLWVATQVGQQTTLRFWASMGIVAGAGLVFAIVQAVGGWTKGLRLRISLGTFLLGFVPSLIVVGWVLLATQPGSGWHSGRFVSWSDSIGVLGVVHALGLWHGVLAFGLGVVLGLSLGTVPALAPAVAADVVVDDETPEAATSAPVATDRWVADEPLVAEREAAHAAEPHTVVVGPSSED